MANPNSVPWTPLRVVVEVKVPPTSRARVGDLRYQVEEALKKTFHGNEIPLPRSIHRDMRYHTFSVKSFTATTAATARERRRKTERQAKEWGVAANG